MNDTFKTLSISFCSSLCTALLVVACTAGADDRSDDDDADTEWGSGTADEWAPGGGTGGDAGPDGVTSAELSDCVLREIASMEPTYIEDHAEEYVLKDWEGDLLLWSQPTCVVLAAYTLCGEMTIPDWCFYEEEAPAEAGPEEEPSEGAAE